ncbi:MAG: NUDIX hydrolase [Deltaproteobacteria bacterium]|nr:MAG: NUDIX hydrolase [Deltaproteobacteria bacterium]
MSVQPRNPYPTVDIIIEVEDRIVLVRRRNPPPGWALPGGFIDYGESAEQAARREAREETGLEVELLEQFHTYSDPDRDPRHHTLSVVFIARARGQPRGGDDAAAAGLFAPGRLPAPLAFDHARIIADWLQYRRDGQRGRFTIKSEES